MKLTVKAALRPTVEPYMKTDIDYIKEKLVGISTLMQPVNHGFFVFEFAFATSDLTTPAEARTKVRNVLKDVNLEVVDTSFNVPTLKMEVSL